MARDHEEECAVAQDVLDEHKPRVPTWPETLVRVPGTVLDGGLAPFDPEPENSLWIAGGRGYMHDVAGSIRRCELSPGGKPREQLVRERLRRWV